MWPTPKNVTEDKTLHNRAFVFTSRDDAAAVLATLLADYRDSDALVLGIPAGGVPVATRLATDLGLALNVLVVSKITLPWNPEAGYGAIAADGTCKINDSLVNQVGLNKNTINAGIRKTADKVAKRDQQFRKILGHCPLDGKTVILVDDGLASGFTMMVAIAAARNQYAGRIIVAVPTGHSISVIEVARECDHLYCANVRTGMRYAVAEAYEQWSDVGEQEVTEKLKEFVRQENPA